MTPTYLGDGVYAAIENGMVKLTTGSHLDADATNTIFLEPDVMDALKDYYERALAFYEKKPGISELP